MRLFRVGDYVHGIYFLKKSDGCNLRVALKYTCKMNKHSIILTAIFKIYIEFLKIKKDIGEDDRRYGVVILGMCPHIKVWVFGINQYRNTKQ